MARYAYERLSAQDNDFLLWETPELPMHVGSTMIFERGPLANDQGGVDFEAIKRLTESVLHRIPRYRQKIVNIPGHDRAVWVDDNSFNLDYHFRHTSLPRPGDGEKLRRLAARIMEHALDRTRPLWETWVVEGLEGDRFAVISKIHHCMMDGRSGVDLSQILLSADPLREIHAIPRFIPRPMPSSRELRRDERRRLMLAPVYAARQLFDFAQRSPQLLEDVSERARAIASLARFKIRPASETPWNGPVGPHRITDWVSIPLADVKAVRRALDCSVNDVILSVATGAVRRFMERRQVRPEMLDFRVSTPVDVRSSADRDKLGNRVSSWVIPLPVDEDDPVRQAERVREQTRRAKENHQALAVDMLNTLHEWLPFDIQSASVGTVNAVITNVPGPQTPLYMLGAKLLAVYPIPPLLENLGLCIGVMSYDGRVCWGLNADYDRVPDLADFADDLRAAFDRLAEAAGSETRSGTKRSKPPTSRPSPPQRAGASRSRARTKSSESPVSPDTGPQPVPH